MKIESVLKDIVSDINLPTSSPIHKTIRKFYENDYHKLILSHIENLKFGSVDTETERGFVSLTSDLASVDDDEAVSEWVVWLAVTETRDYSRAPVPKTAMLLNDVVGLIGIEPIKHLVFIRPLIDTLNDYGKAGYRLESHLSNLDIRKPKPLLFSLAAENKPRVYIRLDYHALTAIDKRYVKLNTKLQNQELDEVLQEFAGF